MRAAALALLLFLAACAEPLPPARAEYAGEWQAKEMWLLISPDGFVSYERQRGSAKTSLEAPITRFEGDNFIVGFGPFTTTFVVSKPPRLDGNVWKMTVDGVELTKGVGRADRTV